MDRTDVLDAIDRDSILNRPFVALTVASCAIATFGLLANSVAVIIGAMLVAPLMAPIVGLALALVSANLSLLRRAGLALSAGALLSVALSAILATLVSLPLPGSEIIARAHPTLLDLGVALAAGAIAGYARVARASRRPSAGPRSPLRSCRPCGRRYRPSLRSSELAYGALLLFATNLIGITLAWRRYSR